MISKPHIYKVNGRWFAKIKVDHCSVVLAPGRETVANAWRELQGQVEAHHGIKLPSAKVKRKIDWKDYVIDQLVMCHIYTKAHENNPVKAVNDLICWHVNVALDPKVSELAIKLQNEAYRKAASLCLDKDYPFDIDILRDSTKSGVMAIMARRLGEEIKKLIMP